MSVQLPLGLSLNDSATFENFVAGPNAAAFSAVHACAGGDEPSVLYLWGAPGAGRTHLLQAACHAAARRGAQVAYLPLEQVETFSVEVCEGMEAMSLVCVDDVERVAGRDDWEQALFNLFNRVRDGGGHLLFAAAASPRAAGLRLPDLISRLGAGPVFRLEELDDAGKCRALSLRARERGLELPEEAARFLLRHYPRDLQALLGLLERLDHASLAAQRRLTVPFIKETLGGQ